MRKCANISPAVSHIWLCNCSIRISLYMRKIWFSFLSVYPRIRYSFYWCPWNCTTGHFTTQYRIQEQGKNAGSIQRDSSVRWFFDHSNLSTGYKTKISQIVGFGQELVEKGNFFMLFSLFVFVFCHGRPVYIPLFNFLKYFPFYCVRHCWK